MSSRRRSRPADPWSADPTSSGSSTIARRPTRSLARSLLPGLLPGLLLCLSLGGCATSRAVPDRDVERRATLQRWSRCIERQSDVATLSDVRARLAHGCEGHRRDVLRVFPVHMAPRLERLMDERTGVVLRTRVRGDDATRAPGESMLKGVIDALSTS